MEDNSNTKARYLNVVRFLFAVWFEACVESQTVCQPPSKDSTTCQLFQMRACVRSSPVLQTPPCKHLLLFQPEINKVMTFNFPKEVKTNIIIKYHSLKKIFENKALDRDGRNKQSEKRGRDEAFLL